MIKLNIQNNLICNVGESKHYFISCSFIRPVKNKNIPMRRIVLILFVTFFIQGLSAQGLRLGVKIDPQYSWFPSSDDFVMKSGGRLGLNGGLVLDKYFAENYALSTGISISGIGGSLYYADSVQLYVNNKNKTIPDNEKITYKLQYIELPLGVKLKTREFGYITIFTQIGLTTQFRIKALIDTNLEDIDDDDAAEEINPVDFGYHFGGGVQYSLGANTSLMLGLIYKNGFTDVTKLKSDKVTSNTLSLRVGVMF